MERRWDLRALYLYLVCLITLIIVIFSAASLVRNIVELAYPDPYASGYVGDRPSGMSQMEWERQQRASQDSARRNDVLALVGSVTLLGVAAPVYLIHWRKVQAERIA